MRPRPPADGREFISVVIPTRNRCGALRECLEAFSRQTYPRALYEVVVVDDGSTDDTGRFLERRAAELPFLRRFSQEQGGPARARNVGIREARGPLILFTGDDCVPDARLLEEHAGGHRGERNVAVLGRIEWHPDLEITPFMEFVGRTHQFAFPVIERERLNSSYCFFYTSNISLPKELLLAGGTFDEEFPDAASEDTELGYRLWKQGMRIVYRRKALTYHRHAVTLEQYIQRQITKGKSLVLLYRKHPEIADVLEIEEAVSPEIRERFYDAVLRYYRAVGIQIGLARLKGQGLDEGSFIVPMDDILKGWSAKVGDRLLRRLNHEAMTVKRLHREVVERGEELERERARAAALEGKGRALEQELDHYRAFAGKVKATPFYRIYKSVRALLGRGEPPL